MLGSRYHCTITIVSKEMGLDQWKLYQFRNFDGMVHKKADLYHWLDIVKVHNLNKHDVRSGESRIIFLPERSSICQYPPKISAINIKKQSRARLHLAHPVLYILKIQKTYGTFWKPPFQNQPKSVRLYLRKWFRQCNLSSLNLTPHTIAYVLILYLQSTYPKIANLILILYIVCRSLSCFKGGSCERFAIDVIQISTTRRTGFNWCEALG